MERDASKLAENKKIEPRCLIALAAPEPPPAAPAITIAAVQTVQAISPALTPATPSMTVVGASRSTPAISQAPQIDSASRTIPVAAAAQTTRAPQPRNRRKSARQDVDTSATIFLINVGSTLRGRILDLSVGGCHIRTDERFPVGIYTRVETEFRLEGLPFRLGGVIQVVHDRHNVGIRFLNLSERKRQQVTDFICEIEQMRAAESSTESTQDSL